jgi:hypothetical protein
VKVWVELVMGFGTKRISEPPKRLAYCQTFDALSLR